MKTLCVLIFLLAFTKISLQGCFEMKDSESLPYDVWIRNRVKGWFNQGALMYFGKRMDRSTFLNGDDADFLFCQLETWLDYLDIEEPLTTRGVPFPIHFLPGQNCSASLIVKDPFLFNCIHYWNSACIHHEEFEKEYHINTCKVTVSKYHPC